MPRCEKQLMDDTLFYKKKIVTGNKMSVIFHIAL